MLSYTNPEPQPSVEESQHPDHDRDHDNVYADIKKNQQNHHRDDETATDTDTDTAQTGVAEDSPVKMPEKSAAAVENKIVDNKANHMQLSVHPDRGGAKGGGKELLRVLADLDDYFLAASESGHEVSKMLEANRLHYHSNFADNKDFYALDMDEVDIVLGYPWIKSVGTININVQKKFLKLWYKKKKITLQDVSLNKKDGPIEANKAVIVESEVESETEYTEGDKAKPQEGHN